MKTVRDWKIELPKIKDVTIIEKALEEELALEKPRKGVVEILKAKIELLTIKPSESTSNEVNEEEADVVTSESVEVVEEPIKAVILHKERDILLILKPYQEQLSDFKLETLVWKDTSDKIGYKKIKDALKSLVSLRKTVDAEKKTFTEPYRTVVSFVNENSANLIGEIQDFESILKKKKESYDSALATETQIKNDKKALALAEKIKKEQEQIDVAKKAESYVVQSQDFQSKYSGIIGRTKSNSESIEEDVSNDNDNPFGNEQVPKNLFEYKGELSVGSNHSKPILTDKQILTTKLELLEKIIDMDTPDSEFFMTPCNIIDKNVQQIINHIRSKFGV
jgi:hypothetical protein